MSEILFSIPRDVWQHVIIPILEPAYQLALRHVCNFLRIMVGSKRRYNARLIWSHVRWNVSLRRWMLRHYFDKIKMSRDTLVDAAVDGNLKCIRWVFKQGRISCTPCLGPAAGAGQLHVLRWASRHLIQFHDRSYQQEMLRAAMNNRLKKVILWLAKHDRELDWDEYAVAALDNDDSLFRWILRTQRTSARVTYAVLKRGRMDLVPWLEKKQLCFREPIVCQTLIFHGMVDPYRWARENGFPVNKECVFAAISANSLELFKDLAQPYVQTDPSLLSTALATNPVYSAITQWLLSQPKLAVDETSRERAITIGNLHLVRTLREKHGMLITSGLLKQLAEDQNWRFVQELITYKDCEIPIIVTNAAANAQKLSLVMDIAALGGPLTPSCLTLAIRVGTIEQVKDLLEKFHCPIDSTVHSAALITFDQTISQFLMSHSKDMQKRAQLVI